jgi:L-alanine-DL-glutamate epimerase-like enolase superfamily enzyme
MYRRVSFRRLQDFDLTWVEERVAAEALVGHRTVRELVRPVPSQTGENWWFPHGMANAIAVGASDLAMVCFVGPHLSRHVNEMNFSFGVRCVERQ